MQKIIPDYLREFCGFLEHTSYSGIPENVKQRARLVLADSIAAIAGGSVEPEVTALTNNLLPEGREPGASVIGTALCAEPMKAALINGSAGTFLEMDEGNQFCRGHPGRYVVPAILANAETRGSSGKDLILALILGYEVGARIGIACKLRMSMHPHGTWGTVGAAVGVGSLEGCSSKEFEELVNMSSSLGLATSRKTMLEGGTVRNSYTGISNQMGLLANQMLQSGFTGEQDGLSTVFGTVVSESFDAAQMTFELGSRWEIARNYFKMHSCCRYNHGALDALDQILSVETVSAEEITSIRVETYSLAAQLVDRQPQNTLAAKFSLPFALATTLVNQDSGVQSFTWKQVRNSKVQELATRVEVVEDPVFTAMMPDFRPARIMLELQDGRKLHAETRTNRGDSEDPYQEEELRSKFLSLTGRVFQQKSCEQIHRQIMEVDQLEDIRSLMKNIREEFRAGDGNG